MKRGLRTLIAVNVVVFLWTCPPALVAAADTQQQTFPAPGKWECTFKPGASWISYFLKGNVHDTLGYVRTIKGSAAAVIDDGGGMAEASVRFSFLADVMTSDDEARDERMDKKFMEIHLFPEVSFEGAGTGASLQQRIELAGATKDKPLAFDLEGKLTVHGATRPVTIPVTAYPDNGLLVTDGSTTLQLQDYNIKNPSLLFLRTENNVKIDFHIELQPQGSPAP